MFIAPIQGGPVTPGLSNNKHHSAEMTDKPPCPQCMHLRPPCTILKQHKEPLDQPLLSGPWWA
jgi:hypothetical protein